MARINIEDRLWKDPRYELLVAKIGENRSLAQLIKLWKLGQKYWALGEKPIPEEVYRSKRFSKALEDAEFVKKHDDGYYVKGSKRRFSWLLQKIEAGKRGGSAPKQSQKQKTVKNQQSKESVSQSVQKAGEQACEKPPILPPSSAPKREQTTKREAFPSETTRPSAASKRGDTAFVVAIFCSEYRRRYDVAYRVTGKDIATLKRIEIDVGKDVYKRLCQAYMEMVDPWFLNKRHDVTTFGANLAKVSQFEQTGKHVSQREIREIDNKAANENMISKVERGEF